MTDLIKPEFDHKLWASRVPLAGAILCLEWMEKCFPDVPVEQQEQVQGAMEALRERIAKDVK